MHKSNSQNSVKTAADEYRLQQARHLLSSLYRVESEPGAKEIALPMLCECPVCGVFGDPHASHVVFLETTNADGSDRKILVVCRPERDKKKRQASANCELAFRKRCRVDQRRVAKTDYDTWRAWAAIPAK